MACKTLFQYMEDMGNGMAPYCAEILSVILPNLGPRNTEVVKVVSTAVVPRLIRIAGHQGAPGATIASAGAMLEAGLAALAQMVDREGGQAAEEMEPVCIAADALCECLHHVYDAVDNERARCGVMAPLSIPDDLMVKAVMSLAAAVGASMTRTRARAERGVRSSDGVGGASCA
ncbi:unnamed protein product [Discosporangium mesarthrocarpum]